MRTRGGDGRLHAQERPREGPALPRPDLGCPGLREKRCVSHRSGALLKQTKVIWKQTLEIRETWQEACARTMLGGIGLSRTQGC